MVLFLFAFISFSPLHAWIGVRPNNRVLLTCGISTAKYIEQISKYPFSEDILINGERANSKIIQYHNYSFDAISIYSVAGSDSLTSVQPFKLILKNWNIYKSDGELSWSFNNFIDKIAGREDKSSGHLTASLVFDDFSKWKAFEKSDSKIKFGTITFTKEEVSRIYAAARRNALAQNDNDQATVGKSTTILKMSAIYDLKNNHGYGRLVCALWANENSDKGVLFSSTETPSISYFVNLKE
jgi:hypothetical protein